MVDMLRCVVEYYRQFRRIDCVVYYRWDDELKELVPYK